MVKNTLVLKNYKLDKNTQLKYIVELKSDLAVWEKNHFLLKNLSDEKKFGSNKKFENLIHTQYQSIQKDYDILVNILKSVNENSIQSINDLELIASGQSFLEKMDKIVFTYDEWSTKQVITIKKFEWILMFFTVVTLLVEALMIFSPLIKYVKEVIGKLSNSEKKQLEINDQLRFSNRMLLQAQEKLEIATREKYQMQLAEEEAKTSALLKGQEEERKRMSLEMHDGVGQMLTGIKLVAGKLKSFKIENDLKYKKTVENLNILINEAIDATRTVSFDLMPPVLVDYGLLATLKIVKENLKRLYGLNLLIESSVKSERFSNKLEINIYRIIQETINNSIKHGKAKSLIIRFVENESYVFLELEDDGVGFRLDSISDEKQSVIHNGLMNMKTRANLLGGQIKIKSEIGKGTNIFLKLPKS